MSLTYNQRLELEELKMIVKEQKTTIKEYEKMIIKLTRAMNNNLKKIIMYEEQRKKEIYGIYGIRTD